MSSGLMNLVVLPRLGQVARPATWGVWGMQGTRWDVGTGLGSEGGWADWEVGDVAGWCRCGRYETVFSQKERVS